MRSWAHVDEYTPGRRQTRDSPPWKEKDAPHTPGLILHRCAPHWEPASRAGQALPACTIVCMGVCVLRRQLSATLCAGLEGIGSPDCSTARQHAHNQLRRSQTSHEGSQVEACLHHRQLQLCQIGASTCCGMMCRQCSADRRTLGYSLLRMCCSQVLVGNSSICDIQLRHNQLQQHPGQGRTQHQEWTTPKRAGSTSILNNSNSHKQYTRPKALIEGVAELEGWTRSKWMLMCTWLHAPGSRRAIARRSHSPVSVWMRPNPPAASAQSASR